jgi:hypothetical protein
MRRDWIFGCALGALACGSPAPAAESTTSTVATTTTTTTTEASAEAVAPAAVVEALPEPVDLLHAIGTELAVSSAYRDQPSQVDHLVDGDATTAWNSRTGELVGAWIEVRLPAEATVTSLSIVPGFARTGGETDLFTGNHRVSGIRVLRDGTELGTYPIDTSAPVAVSVPVSGPGGVYRIEVTEVLPGSRTDWRETCISELAILGRAPAMAPGTRLPRTAIGALPEALVVDRDAIARAQHSDASWLLGAWNDLQRDLDNLDQSTGEPDPDAELSRELEHQRVAMLHRIATSTAPVDGAASDALRAAAAYDLDWSDSAARHRVLGENLEALGTALGAVADFLGDDEARCRAARTHAGMRLRRVASAAFLESYVDEIDAFEASMTGDEPTRGEGSHAREADATTLTELAEDWGSNTRGVATRVMRLGAPHTAALASDWEVLRAQIEICQRTCGWPAP